MRRALLLVLGLWAFAIPAWAYDDIAGVRYVKCYDGDTCTFELQDVPSIFEHIEVRFRGIDTPERKGKCPQETAKAQAARLIVMSYLEQAKTITLTKVNRDKYFRLNAYVLADGRNLSDELIRLGYAVEYWGTGPKKDWCHAG